MKTVRAAALAAMILFLGACQRTLEELREEPGERIAFHIAAPFQTIYQNFDRTLRHCYGGGYGATYTVVQSSETVPGRVANITHWQKGIVERPLFTVDLLKTGEGTDVIYYKRGNYGVFTEFEPVVRGWATGSGECSGLTFVGPLEPPEITRLPETSITPISAP